LKKTAEIDRIFIRGKMKKIIYLALLLTMFLNCVHKQEKVDKIIEDGVEVILNHIDPYKIKTESVAFNLEEIFTIDTENFELARIGLTDIRCFDVDSKGNIYFLKFKSSTGDNIIKFDKNGKYITSFGSTGQGPGEFQYPFHLEVDKQDHIVVTDQARLKLMIFNGDGRLTKDINITRSGLRIAKVSCLENGKYITFGQVIGSYRGEYIQITLRLFNAQFEEVKELERYNFLNIIITNKRKGTYPIWAWSISKGAVYTGNEERGYEIWVYDLEGNLIRKIKKEYKSVPVSDEYKKLIMEKTPENLKKITFFPDSFPSYQSFFTDDKGRLFVMTYEEGENPGEFMFDIFNPDGVFIGRKSLNVWIWESLAKAKIINNLFYCVQEKESGYKKFVVSKMKWE
jgi:hypothetical protein